MSEFDEISRAIGRLEGRLKGIEDKQDAHGKELTLVRETLTAHRLKVAGMASLISGGIAAAYHLLKGNH